MKIFLLAVLMIFANDSDEKESDAKLESRVKYFNMASGVYAELQRPFVAKFIELVDEQQNRISKTRRNFEKLAQKTRNDQKLSNQEILEKLVTLRSQQDDAIKKILLPDQLLQLETFEDFALIHSQGLANSLVFGTLAQQLELSKKERIAVEKAAEKIQDRYRSDLIAAQKKAIAALSDSLPVEKRKRLKKLLEPLLSGDGTFWKIESKMLSTEPNPNFKYSGSKYNPNIIGN